MIGRTNSNEKISIDSKKAYNNFILVMGKSGTGKSTFIQKYIGTNEMEEKIVLIPDYTGDWKNRIQEGVNVINCRNEGLSVPVFERQKTSDSLETDYEMAKRITDIFKVVYRLGSVQSALLQEIIQSEIQETDKISWKRVLESLRLKKGTESLCLKIQWIIESRIFDNTSSRTKFARTNIFDLSGLSMDNQNICMEFFLWWSFDYVVRRQENTPIVIILDEFQRINFKENSPLVRLLTEGRKYGIELLLATPTISIFSREQKVILEQVGTKIYFHPPELEINMIKGQFPVNIQNRVKERLSQLPVGHALAVGNFKVNGQERMSNNPIEIIV